MNVESLERWTAAQVKKKWFDIKVDAIKRITDQKKKKKTGGGQGPPDLSAQDERLSAIIGQTSIRGIFPRNEVESDDIEQLLSLRGNSFVEWRMTCRRPFTPSCQPKSPLPKALQ